MIANQSVASNTTNPSATWANHFWGHDCWQVALLRLQGSLHCIMAAWLTPWSPHGYGQALCRYNVACRGGLRTRTQAYKRQGRQEVQEVLHEGCHLAVLMRFGISEDASPNSRSTMIVGWSALACGILCSLPRSRRWQGL